MVDLRSVQAQSQRLGLEWQPGETTNSSLSRLAARARTGAIPPGGKRVLNARVRAAARADHDGARAAAVSLPPVVDWRRNGGNFVTPVKDQAFCGSCVAFGTIAVLESMVRIAGQAPGLSVDLSEAHLYFCYGPDRGALPCPDGGWWPDDSFACLRTGVVDEIGFPYTDVDQPCRLGPDATNRRTTASNIVMLDRVVDMKRHLATVGPLAACFTTYEDFTFFYRGGVYRYNEETSGEYVGGHCVAIIGYDDAQRCWIAKNSWGTEWGAGGFFRIGYGEVGIDASMWGITGTVKSPLLSSLHVVGAQANTLRHTTRTPKPAWSASTTVDTPPPAGPFRKVSTAGAGAALHVVGLADHGGETNLWHSLRKATGEWQAAFGNIPDAGGNRTFSAVTCAATGASLHVLGVDNGVLRHTIRTASGWRPSFTPLKIPEGEGTLTAVGAAGVEGALQLVAVIGGALWHRRRSTSGTWSGWTKIITPSVAGAFTAVSCAGFSEFLHVVGVGAKGESSNLWHTIRKPDGSRQTSVANIRDEGQDRTFSAASCAIVGQDLHVLGLANGDIWHTMRSAARRWKATWGTPPGQDVLNGFVAVSGSAVR
jgi:C1A family cysteine protease